MLRLIHYGNSQPTSFICDPSVSFQPGQCAEMTVIGNQVMATVSSGLCPIGIIDDIRTAAFTGVSWNEVIIVPAVGVVGPGGRLVTPIDISKELKKPYVIPSSFVSTVNVSLNPTNGIITFVAGTELNFDLLGTGQPNAIRTVVNYTYNITNVPGDDSTAGSHRITVWYGRMFFQTNMFESNQSYPVRCNLFVSENGLFTSRQPSSKHPAIATCTSPPSPSNSFLGAMWY